MPKFNGINYKELQTDVIVVYRYPYCSKKFLNKKSYRKHIIGGFCPLCNVKTGKSTEISIPLEWLKRD